AAAARRRPTIPPEGLTLPLGQGSSVGGMNETSQIRERITAFCQSTNVPGFPAGVYHGGEETVVAHGVANVATRAPMRADTGFLFGSITKVLTTTLVLQQRDPGTVDLDEPVLEYLPEFRLPDPSA